jgi:hypothetical protein
MKKTIGIIGMYLWLGAGFLSGQVVRMDEASSVSQNWVRMIIDRYGGWGTSATASAQPMQELRYQNRLIGYFCAVKPHGFIIVSLRKELAPVKAYSCVNDLDMTEDLGMARLLKMLLTRIIGAIESRVGSIETVGAEELADFLEVDYRDSWNYVERYVPGTINPRQAPLENYQEGDVLLTSRWHQFPPYNNDCPAMGCTTTTNGRALVGCVATAGTQIMKYWNWPPFGVGGIYNDSYDWRHMPDHAATWSSAEEQAAVAELSREVGVAVNMDYGCDASGAYTSDMVGVYELIFRFHTSCDMRYRSDYTASTWFALIKGQLNANRALQYKITDTTLDFSHSLVCDGWQEIGSPVIMQYHMNFGWDTTVYNVWYTVDEIGNLNSDQDGVLIGIVPATRLGSTLAGTYPRASFPYRYFDVDASGDLATFDSGQLLQMLPGVTVRGNQSSTAVTFHGTPALSTSIHTRGDVFRGVIIWNGALKLKSGGMLKLR